LWWNKYPPRTLEYIAHAVSDIFVKTGDEFIRLSEAPRETPIVNQDGKGPKRVHGENQGEPDKEGETREYLEKTGVSGR
jgi:hypothetical protein